MDLLDVVSYYIKPDQELRLSIKELIGIKEKIESAFSSIEVEIDDSSIHRLQRKYSDSVTFKDSSIQINFSTKEYKEVMQLRSSYMEDRLKQIF